MHHCLELSDKNEGFSPTEYGQTSIDDERSKGLREIMEQGLASLGE